VKKVQVKEEKSELAAAPRSEDERSEPERSGAAASSAAPSEPPAAEAMMPNPEVSARSMRRRFSGQYKRSILKEADSCDPGGIAALLRREGLYSSHLTSWRRQRESGEIAGLQPRKRGKKPGPKSPLAGEVQRLTRENQHLQKRLKQAEIIIDVQKKLCDILGLTVPPIEQNEDEE
jgi:transposase